MARSLKPNAEGELKTALNEFSLKFLKTYHQNEEKHSNLFYSSVSLASALSLVAAGADGKTRKELVDLLGFEGLMDDETLKVLFKKVRLKHPMN